MKITVAAKTEAAGFENLRALLNDMGCKNVDIAQHMRKLNVAFTAPRNPMYFSAGPESKSVQVPMLQALKKDGFNCKYTAVLVSARSCVAVFTVA